MNLLNMIQFLKPAICEILDLGSIKKFNSQQIYFWIMKSKKKILIKKTCKKYSNKKNEYKIW